MKSQLEVLDRLAITYEAFLFDNQRIRDTIDLYDTLILLFFEWI